MTVCGYSLHKQTISASPSTAQWKQAASTRDPFHTCNGCLHVGDMAFDMLSCLTSWLIKPLIPIAIALILKDQLLQKHRKDLN